MTLPTEPDPEDLRIVDDSPIEAARYRIGAVFDLYHDGTSVKFRVTEVIDPRHVLRVHLWPERRALGGLIGALAIGTVLPLMGPIILGHFVDRATRGAKTGELIAIATAYLVIAAGAQVATVVRTWVA